ncbi:MFS transporter [Actinospica robiniae]|uniref:MFS transporter n=1 Tax=Actinospica robiniae TaxID=304901 RepID=UPI000686100D|nr:MFS transporter [Actinospica robiniae]
MTSEISYQEPDERRARVRVKAFEHPFAFWSGAIMCAVGVGLHLPMYYSTRSMHYVMAGMRPDATMIIGMALIGVGLLACLYGLVPRGASGFARDAAGIRVRALDETPLNARHVMLLIVLSVAVTIDAMKPTALSFVAPGMAKEYDLLAPTNAHGHTSVAWLPLVGITGTVLGSWIWGSLADRIGRRSAIVFAGILFMTTSICGAMPGYGWNLMMCLFMGIGAGGMLPIAFALMVETVPARHRGWAVVLVGGNTAAAYAVTSWLAATLTPTYSWRILWLIGLPTGVLFIALNHWIPESPRFLLATGRREEAERVMARYGAAVRSPEAGQEEEAYAESGSHYRFRHVLRGSFAAPTLAISVLAIGLGLVTYGFQQWVPTNLQHLGYTAVKSDYVVRNAALLGLPVTAAVAWLYQVWGSRRTIVASASLTALALAGFVLEGNRLVHDHALLSVLLVIPLAGVGSTTAVVAGYAAELYPTRIRSRGAGLAAGMTKAGGVLILAVVVASKTVPSITMTAVIGAVPLLIAAICFVWIGPETARRGLESITREMVAAGRG